jgi:NADH-quinone oxidoreductase subunit B
MQLQRKVKAENFFGTTNRKEKDPYKDMMDEKNVKLLNQEEQA